MRWLRVSLLVLLGLLALARPVEAQGCSADAFDQSDMAGVYVSPEQLVRVEVGPCGSTFVLWDNAYGRHAATYASVKPLDGGGFTARGVTNSDGGFLDNTGLIGVKPAEPGYIQLITASPYGDAIHVYRLEHVIR